jgi:hypothetical protein
MRHPARPGALAALLVLGTVAGASAQADQSRFRITPVVGWYSPTQHLGVVSGGEEPVRLQAEASPAFGAAVETTVPGTAIEVRGQLLYAPSTGVSASRFDRFEPCGTDCSRAVYTSDPLAAGSVVLAVADAVVRLPRLGPARFYGVAGGGARKYSFDREELGSEYSQALSDGSARFVAHVGLGVSANVGPVELTAEAGDYFGHYRVMNPEAASTDRMQHDLGVTLGIRRAIR